MAVQEGRRRATPVQMRSTSWRRSLGSRCVLLRLLKRIRADSAGVKDGVADMDDEGGQPVSAMLPMKSRTKP